MRGNLTPEEVTERDERARERRERHARADAARATANDARRLCRHRLRKAAGIGHTTFVCHADAWNFVSHHVSYRIDWSNPRPDDYVSRPGGMREVSLSGPELVIILDRMAEVCGIGGDPGAAGRGTDRAVAARIYDAVGTVVDHVDRDAPNGLPVPPIVIDGRIAAARPKAR